MKDALSSLTYPLRINVNYLVEGAAAEYAADMNALADRVGVSEIQFAPRGIAIPHITMIMGEVYSRDQLVTIGDRLAKLRSELHPISYGLTLPYYPTYRSNYLFVDVTPYQTFREHKNVINSTIGDLIRTNSRGSVDNVAHVTLAYISNGGREEILRHARLCERPPRAQANTLQISLTGAYGTCIETLASYDID